MTAKTYEAVPQHAVIDQGMGAVGAAKGEGVIGTFEIQLHVDMLARRDRGTLTWHAGARGPVEQGIRRAAARSGDVRCWGGRG